MCRQQYIYHSFFYVLADEAADLFSNEAQEKLFLVDVVLSHTDTEVTTGHESLTTIRGDRSMARSVVEGE